MPDLRVWCEAGHARVPAALDVSARVWRCPRCPETLTEEAAVRHVPPGYRPSSVPGVAALQDLMATLQDYEFAVIVHGARRVTVEYPRPSHRRGRS